MNVKLHTNNPHTSHYKDWIPQAVRAVRGDETLKDFAEKCGISLSYLSDIENGRTIPTIETLDKIFIAGGAVLTIGYQFGYVPPAYKFILNADVEALRAILRKIDDGA